MSYDRILEFWLGELDSDGLADAAHSAFWWKKDDAFDREIERRFGAEHRAIVAGERESWLADPRGRLAYVIALDQFSRNMFRGTPAMFAADSQALRVAMDGIDRAEDRKFAVDECVFLYMPLMHAEDLAIQERCVALFSGLVDRHQGAARQRVANNVRFAQAHRDIVARFGRFPHRNALLGRPSTADEEEFLKGPNSSF
jgi:uncharacterized protein (DUF924 family)